MASEVKVNAFPERKAIERAGNKSFPVLVQVTAPPQPPSAEDIAGVDVVALLDTSKSMDRESRLVHLKEAMKIVIGKLGDNDRLAIVQFNAKADTVMSLTKMCNDDVRHKATICISNLEMDHKTNMCDALKMGAQILRDRDSDSKSRLGCMMFLSDGGNPRNGVYKDQDITDEFPVYTFGLGVDHEPWVMKYIADTTHGTYSFVNQDITKIKNAFEFFITGLKSVTARYLEITIEAHAGVTVSGVRCGGYHDDKKKQTVKDNGSKVTIAIPDIYAHESKNIVVDLTVAEGESSKLITVYGSYQTLSAKETLRLDTTEVCVERPPSCSPDQLAICRPVAAELTLIELEDGLKVMEECPTGTELTELWKKIKGNQYYSSIPKAFLLGIEKAVDQMKQGLGNSDDDGDNSDDEGCTKSGVPKSGVPFMLSWLTCRKWQRTTWVESSYIEPQAVVDSNCIPPAVKEDGCDPPTVDPPAIKEGGCDPLAVDPHATTKEDDCDPPVVDPPAIKENGCDPPAPKEDGSDPSAIDPPTTKEDGCDSTAPKEDGCDPPAPKEDGCDPPAPKEDDCDPPAVDPPTTKEEGCDPPAPKEDGCDPPAPKEDGCDPPAVDPPAPKEDGCDPPAPKEDECDPPAVDPPTTKEEGCDPPAPKEDGCDPPTVDPPTTTKEDGCDPPAVDPPAIKEDGSDPPAPKEDGCDPPAPKEDGCNPPAVDPPVPKEDGCDPPTVDPLAPKEDGCDPPTVDPLATKEDDCDPPAPKEDDCDPPAVDPPTTKEEGCDPPAPKEDGCDPPAVDPPTTTKEDGCDPPAVNPPAIKEDGSDPPAPKEEGCDPPAVDPPATKEDGCDPPATKEDDCDPPVVDPPTTKEDGTWWRFIVKRPWLSCGVLLLALSLLYFFIVAGRSSLVVEGPSWWWLWWSVTTTTTTITTGDVVSPCNATSTLVIPQHTGWAKMEKELVTMVQSRKEEEESQTGSLFHQAASSDLDVDLEIQRYLYMAIVHATALRSHHLGASVVSDKVVRTEVSKYLRRMPKVMEGIDIPSFEGTTVGQMKERMDHYLYSTIVQSSAVHASYWEHKKIIDGKEGNGTTITEEKKDNKTIITRITGTITGFFIQIRNWTTSTVTQTWTSIKTTNKRVLEIELELKEKKEMVVRIERELQEKAEMVVRIQQELQEKETMVVSLREEFTVSTAKLDACTMKTEKATAQLIICAKRVRKLEALISELQEQGGGNGEGLEFDWTVQK